jgi:hypothetical protein
MISNDSAPFGALSNRVWVGKDLSGEVFGGAFIKLHLPQQSGPSGRRMPS